MDSDAQGDLAPRGDGTMLDWALRYAALGWRVIPVRGKRPFLDGWPEKASTDPETIRGWWRDYPDSNIGIATGPGTGHFALDVDGDEGRETLRALEAEHGRLPDGPRSRTGGGGEHRLLLVPTGRTWPRNRVRFASKLDIRSAGGQFVAAPSVHPDTGRVYAWEVDPRNTPIPEAPAWLLDLVEAAGKKGNGNQKPAPPAPPASSAGPGITTRYGHAALDRECEMVRTAPKGTRNATLNKAALKLGQRVAGGELDGDEARIELMNAARDCGLVADDGERQCLATIASGLAKGATEPKAAPPRSSPSSGRGNGRRAQAPPADRYDDPPTDCDPGPSPDYQGEPPAGMPLEVPLPWEDLIPFEDLALPDFPTDVFPAWLRAFVEAEATASQTPIDLAALTALGMLAVACAKQVNVRDGNGHEEPVNLYVMTAMEPGSRKSAVMDAIKAPVSEAQAEAMDAAQPAYAATKARIDVEEAVLARLKAEAAKATGVEQQDILQRVEEKAKLIAQSPLAELPRLFTSDPTSESIPHLLASNRGRFAIVSDEGGIFGTMAGRYSSNKTPNFESYLKGHAGSEIHTDRVGRHEHVGAPALTLVLSVQPDIIRSLAETPQFKARGLCGRFLYAVPKSTLGYRQIDPPAVPDQVRSEYHFRLRALLSLPLGGPDGKEAVARRLNLSPSAHAELSGFRAWAEPQYRPGEALSGFTDWSGKLPGAVARIAGLLHMAELAGDPAPWNTPLSGDTMARAVRLGRYLVPHAKAAYEMMGSDVELDGARWVLDWILRSKRQVFAKRDLHRAAQGRFRRASDLDAPLEVLVERNYIREAKELAARGRGRPSKVYEVNPGALNSVISVIHCHSGSAEQNQAEAQGNGHFCHSVISVSKGYTEADPWNGGVTE